MACIVMMDNISVEIFDVGGVFSQACDDNIGQSCLIHVVEHCIVVLDVRYMMR